jgi:hypothetical protein
MRPARTACCLSIACLAALLVGGCGYSFDRPYRSDVDSVAVEMFARGGQVYRREIEFLATEAIKKRIAHQTDYVLTDRGRADSLLSGTIDVISQTNLTTEPGQGVPRESEVTLSVSFTWVDRRTGKELASRKNLIAADTYARIDPLDEGFSTARDRAIDQLSRRIVEAMEVPIAAPGRDEPWDDEPEPAGQNQPR